MDIYVIRHARTKAEDEERILGRVDEDILETERESIITKAQELKGNGIKRIYTSPLLRARKTAEIIAEELGIKYELREALIERDFGLLNGLSWQEFSTRYPQEVKDNTANYQPDLAGAETIKTVEERVKKFVEKLNKDNGPYLLVTHSGVIRVILREFGNFLIEETRKVGIKNLEWFYIDRC